MNDPVGTAVRFQVLGPLRALRQEDELRLGPAQRRVILAVLLLQRNHPIGRDQLIDAVWGTHPPAYAVNLLQQHVSQLRRTLEPDRQRRSPAALLAWTGTGYLLEVPPNDLDLGVFDREAARGRAARAAGDLPTAASALHTATQLWRGPVCDGLSSPLLDTERVRLAERRLDLLADRIEVDMALVPAPELIGELRRLVVEYPLWERLHGLLILALYRSGRRAQALAAYQDARHTLRDELGVEPAAALQRLHHQILTGDPALGGVAAADSGSIGAAPAAGTAATSGADLPPVPAQLPPGVADFTARQTELAELDAAAESAGATMVITAIGGTAGVGKTALAVHWAHRVRDRFPDGQLYVNLRGFDPSGSVMTPEDAVRGFLDAFGVAPQRVPPGLPAQTALYRTLLAGRRILVVLDNARDSEQVRPLLPGTAGCLALVTSRNQLTGLVAESARAIEVDLLTTGEAGEMLARRLGRDRVASEPAAVEQIVAACARLPLALSVVAAQAATHPRFPLAAVAEELRGTRGSLDAFTGDDRTSNLRAVFSWSYERISEAGRRLFRLLGLHWGPDIGTAAAASLAGVAPGNARALLTELTRAHLLTEHVPGRFLLHDLLRAYAAELAAGRDGMAERPAALHRVFDHYLYTAYDADRTLNPHRDDPVVLAPAEPAVVIDRFASQEAASAWFAVEHRVLLAAIHGTDDLDRKVWQLAWTISPFLEYQGHWTAWAEAMRRALQAARRSDDAAGQAIIHRILGCIHIHLGRYGEAHSYLHQALDLYGRLGDDAGLAHVHRHFAWALNEQGRQREALPHAERALDLHRIAGNGLGQGRALNAVGWFHAQLGDYGQAVRYCRQALGLQTALGDQYGEAETLDSLGFAYAHLGGHGDAVACYLRARELYGHFGNRYNEADTLVSLGDVHHSVGDLPAARSAWAEALAILDELGHVDADQVRTKLDKACDSG